MAEEFNVAEFVIPGVFVRVRAEGLISAGGISTGNIGIVGTAGRPDVIANAAGRGVAVAQADAGRFLVVDGQNKPQLTDGALTTGDDGNANNVFKLGGSGVAIAADAVGKWLRVDAAGVPLTSNGNFVTADPVEDPVGKTHILGDYATALSTFGPYDANSAARFNLTRALEILFRNGARTVYARAIPLTNNGSQPGQATYTTEFNELIKDDVNILIAPQLAADTARAVLLPLLESAENDGKDLLAVIGSQETTLDNIKADVVANDRLIVTAPGIVAFDAAAGANVNLSGTYSAAAVAALLATLSPQSSPTNKTLAGVGALTSRFSYSQTKDLISNGVFVLEERSGVRAVRGITTEMQSNGAFKQITTRRIVDFAKAGIRQVSNPFIGKLNNTRVRAALQGAIDGFLTGMVQDEALTEYSLEVTATRADEIAGIARVNAILKPTFSIDFIAVTLTLQ